MLCATLLAGCGRSAPTNSGTPPAAGAESGPSLLSPQDRAEIFDGAWKTIDEEYYDPSFRGVDWRAVGERYRPQALSAQSDAEFYGVFEQMLGELRDGHTVFEPPAPPGRAGEGGPRGSLGLKHAHTRRAGAEVLHAPRA